MSKEGESTKSIITLKYARFIYNFFVIFCILMIEDVILKRKAEFYNKKQHNFTTKSFVVND